MALRNPSFLGTRDYSAMEDRTAFMRGGDLQAGTYSSADMAVTQRGAGANMSVDVSAGWAVVAASSAGNRGMYLLENDSAVNVPGLPSHSSLPRIDQVILRVNDSFDGGGSSDVPQLQMLMGTPTSGATLANRTGAAALPDNCLRLADVFVGAGVTSIANSNIQDRRPRVRGYYSAIYLPSSVSTTSAAFARITSLDRSFETDLRAIEVSFTADFNVESATAEVSFGPSVDGSLPVGTYRTRSWVANAANTFSGSWTIYSVSGWRTFGMMWNVSNAARATIYSAHFRVNEVLG